MTQYQAIKQLYQEAEKEYRDYSEKHSGEWLSGEFPGLSKMLAYRRMLLIMEAESDSTLVDKYVNMSDIELTRKITQNELKEKLADAIYTIVKRVPDFCPDYNQIAKNGADVIMNIIKEYNNDR